MSDMERLTEKAKRGSLTASDKLQAVFVVAFGVCGLILLGFVLYACGGALL